MRDYPDENMTKPDAAQSAGAAEPRGRDALGLSPKGVFYDLVLEPMKGRGLDVAYKATTVFLTVATGAVLVMALLAA